MTFCHLLLLLPLALLWLLLWSWLWATFLGERWVERLQESLCPNLCYWWIRLAFAMGFVLGGLLICCWPELVDLIGDSWCRWALVLWMVLLLWLFVQFLGWWARCRYSGLPTIGAAGFSILWLLVFLLLVFLLSVLWCCWRGLPTFLVDWDLCDTLIVLFFILYTLAAYLRFLAHWVCEETTQSCGRLTYLSWALVILLLFGIALVWICCDELDEEHELAMVGIWWVGEYDGETGAHLRWSFDYDLDFPEGGFDIERRDSAGGSWTLLNSERIHPIVEWGDEDAPLADDMALAVGIERLHEDSWPRFRDQPSNELIAMLAEDFDADLHFVQAPEADDYAEMPQDYYTSEGDAEDYLERYYADDADNPPLATWTLQPRDLYATMGLHPEVARLLGLYWIDLEADPGVEYDYRVTGHWNDETRTYVVLRLSEAGTVPLDTPRITTADSPLPLGTVAGVALEADDVVGLAWTPPHEDPDDLTGPIDVIESVLFAVEHKQEGESDALCPASTTAAGFERIERLDDTGEQFEEIPLVTVAAEEDETTGDQYWPDYYFMHAELDYGCHAYRVVGQDLFGRSSPYSAPELVQVSDLTAPPPPSMVSATLYQRADGSLSDGLQGTYLPDADSHELALVVSWVWTDDQAERAPDAASFQLHVQFTDYEDFVPAGDPDPPWRDRAAWEAHPGAAVALAATEAMPPRYSELLDDAEQPLIQGSYYELVITDVPSSVADEVVTAADLGMDPGDAKPVAYAWLGVTTTDERGNEGAVSAPILYFARDLVAPDPPDPPPALLSEPGPADDQGDATLRLSWPGDALYTYALHRLDVSSLGSIPGNPDLGTLPACLSDEVPSCNPETDGEACAEDHDHFAIRAAAAEATDDFGQVSSLPIELRSSEVEYSDRVDATVSRQLVYAATATDAAGNTSALSCPGEVVLVADSVPPQIPVLTSLVAGDGSLTLSWGESPAVDLESYTIYRTSVEANANSRRRMSVVANLDASGTNLDGGTDATLSGNAPYRVFEWTDTGLTAAVDYIYRVDAVDLSANRSPLSIPLSGRTFDATAPEAPVWSPGFPLVDSGGPRVHLRWEAVAADPELRIQVQRRESGSPLWRGLGGWLEAGVLRYTDEAVTSGTSYDYRMRAMDPSGNRSPWSTEESASP